jgi:steroid delta-isomerase-like uncharacterized protein
MANKHVATLRKAHEAFSAHNFDAAEKLVASSAKVIDHGRNQTMTGRQEFRGWMEAFTHMSSDMTIADARYIDAGDTVIAQFRAVGKQDGPMAGTPFGPSNKSYSLDVCEVWHFNDKGEAVEGHNYSDGYGLLLQLGHMK